MRTARSGFALAAHAGSGTIYALGGSDGTSVAENSVEKYRPLVDGARWKRDDVRMQKRRCRPKAAVVNDKLYVFGGDEEDTVAFRHLRPEFPPQWNRISQLRYKSMWFDVVPFGTYVYLVGARLDDGGKPAEIEVFDTVKEKWLRIATPSADESILVPSGKFITSVSAVIEREYSRL